MAGCVRLPRFELTVLVLLIRNAFAVVRAPLLGAAFVIMFATTMPAQAQVDAVWTGEMNEDWNTDANWLTVPGMEEEVPTGTATFVGVSPEQFPVIGPSAPFPTSIGAIVFSSAGYTIGIVPEGGNPATLQITGAGVTNESGSPLVEDGFVIEPGGTVIFNDSVAQTASSNEEVVYTNNDGTIEFNSSLAGGSSRTLHPTFQNLDGGAITFNNSQAGYAEIDNDAGSVTFRDDLRVHRGRGKL